MAVLICPGCGETVSVNELTVGDRMNCPNCANLTLKLSEKDGRLFLREVAKVSCPSCDRMMEVPEGMGPGESLNCCGEQFTLTYEFGSFALVRDVNRENN